MAGIVFLAIAIAALCKPDLVNAVESSSCFTSAKAMAGYWCPSLTLEAVIIGASFLFGALNTLVFLATTPRRR